MAARKPNSRKKYFTAAQANAMLPLVRRIVQDITELANELRERQERINDRVPAWGEGALEGGMGFHARPQMGQPSPFHIETTHIGSRRHVRMSPKRSDRRMGINFCACQAADLHRSMTTRVTTPLVH